MTGEKLLLLIIIIRFDIDLEWLDHGSRDPILALE